MAKVSGLRLYFSFRVQFSGGAIATAVMPQTKYYEFYTRAVVGSATVFAVPETGLFHYVRGRPLWGLFAAAKMSFVWTLNEPAYILRFNCANEWAERAKFDRLRIGYSRF